MKSLNGEKRAEEEGNVEGGEVKPTLTPSPHACTTYSVQRSRQTRRGAKENVTLAVAQYLAMAAETQNHADGRDGAVETVQICGAGIKAWRSVSATSPRRVFVYCTVESIRL